MIKNDLIIIHKIKVKWFNVIFWITLSLLFFDNKFESQKIIKYVHH